MELRVVTSTAIEARVRMDCGGSDWKVRAEDGREKRCGAELYGPGGA